MGDVFADDELAEFIRSFNALNLPSAAATGADALRSATAERTKIRPPGPELDQVRDFHISPDGPTVRIYRPTIAATGVLVYFHGGGWVIGDLDTHDRACRRLAASSNITVVAVDYRRAPEHRWPAAVDDAVVAVRWVAGGHDELGATNGRIGVAGDSAGGLVAALASLRLRADPSGVALAAQFLLYANTDLTNSGPSMVTEGHGYGLEAADIEWFNTQWVPDRSRWNDSQISPLYADDLTGLPTTVVITCEHDPLRDQGEAYAQRLANAGVPTVVRREPGMVHNFMLWDLISPACAVAADRAAADVASRLTTPDVHK
jgi:acetyl esterase